MDQKNGLPSFSEADIKKVLGSKEGQALLRLLNQDGGAKLRQVAGALKSGDTARAQELAKPLIQTPEAAALIDKINRK